MDDSLIKALLFFYSIHQPINLLKFSALDFSKFGIVLTVTFLVGCATQTQQLKMNESKEPFKNGDLQNTAAVIQGALDRKSVV